MIEFFTDHSNGTTQYRLDDGVIRELEEKDVEIIHYLLDYSKTFYPVQYESVSKIYAKSSTNKRYYDFLMARRIINCCFGELDAKPDIDRRTDTINFEHVKCPLIVECEFFGKICRPKFNSQLSEAEERVMKLYTEIPGIQASQIAKILFLSEHTVNNHRRHVYAKLGINTIAEFISIAEKTGMFNK